MLVYSEYLHFLPDRPILVDWYNRFQVDSSEVGEQLGIVYQELFDDGQIVGILDQIVQKEWANGKNGQNHSY